MTIAGQPQTVYGYNDADQPTQIDGVTLGYDGAGRAATTSLPGGITETYTPRSRSPFQYQVPHPVR
jgi:hypothetical protein